MRFTTAFEERSEFRNSFHLSQMSVCSWDTEKQKSEVRSQESEKRKSEQQKREQLERWMEYRMKRVCQTTLLDWRANLKYASIEWMDCVSSLLRSSDF